MTYDSDERKVLLYAGWAADGPVQDLWQWDGEWTTVDSPLCPVSPAPRS